MTNNTSRVRRAIILAAGKSHRLDSLRLNKPKPLIEIAGQPLLAHHLNRCAAIGVEEVFINLHHLPEQIRAFVGDGSRWKIKVTYKEEAELLGTAGGVKGFSEALRGDSFLVIYGDNYSTFRLDELIHAHFCHARRPDMSLVLFQQDDVSGSGVAVCDQNDLIQSFIEKPAPGVTTSHWANSGIYLMEPHLLDCIPEGTCDFGRDVIPSFLALGKRILGVKTQGRVYAVDTPELLHRARAIQATP